LLPPVAAEGEGYTVLGAVPVLAPLEAEEDDATMEYEALAVPLLPASGH
jgi:hypothetical protein